MPKVRSSSFTTFVRARFSPEGHLGLHLTIGALLLIAASWIFGGIAEDVVGAEEITVIDVQIAQWFHNHATPALTQFMFIVTNLHGTLAISVYSVMLAIFLIRKKDWYWLLALLVSVPGGMLLNVLMKLAFQRARPSFDNPLLSLTTYSFPSGHAAGSALFYGILAAYLINRAKSWRWRIFIGAAALLFVALAGLSRIYLGVHYLSDVLAAVAESSAWLALVLTAIGTVRRRRAVPRF
ncbi:MAG: hypothetical protein JWQ21_2035 [Herminiimonas sp.]|nr:hypothetical protein [Herminiimonas sp.]